ncbi:MAG: T9SS type B sorting domain-containing protein [Saprospiraceae bacterium]
MTRFLLSFLFFIASFCQIQAQCPVILTDKPIEVCSSGGTKVNIEIAGTIVNANWSPAIGLDDATILNPTFLAPLDTTYLLTIIGLDAETNDTCTVQKLIKIDVTVFDLTITQDTVNLPCGDTILLGANVVPNGSFFIIEWETDKGHFTRENQTLTPFVDAVGQYKANVIGTLGRIVCRDTDSLQVVLAHDDLTIVPPEPLHCNQTSTDLTLLEPINTDAYLYNWTTTNGQFATDTDEFATVVNKAGIYEISRTDLFGECEVTARVEVAETIAFTDFSFDLIERNCGATGSLSITDLDGGQAPFQYSIDSGITFQNTPDFENLTEIAYAVLVKDANDCELSKQINFAPTTSFDLSLINFQAVEKGTDFQLPLDIIDNGASIESIQWWPNVGLSCTDCPQPYLTEFKNRRYEVTVKDNMGCEQKTKIEIAILQPNLFYSPTIFSPNDDGQNDVFSIYTNTKFVKQINNLTIFDRYGNLIFQQSVIVNNADLVTWNGRYKGKIMPIGAYIYAGELELLDGEIEQFSGTLNLIR